SLALVAVSAATGAISLPARISTIGALVNPSQIGRATAMVGLTAQTALVVGPSIAGFMMSAASASAALFAAALLLRIGTAPFAALTAEPMAQRQTSPLGEFRQVLRFIREERQLARGLLLFVIVTLAGRGVTDLFAGYVDEALHSGPQS